MTDSSNKRTTIDKGEVERHTVLWNDWWNLSGCLRGLHSFNALRVPFIVENLVLNPEERESAHPLKDKKILDIGCGGGIVSEALAKLGADVTGVDASSTIVEMATKHSKNNPQLGKKPTYVCASIEEHAEKYENYYDAVVASEIVDHVADPDLFLNKCVKTLKPRGKIFITAPNRTAMAKLFVMYVAVHIFNLIPKGLHVFERFTTHEEVSSILAKNNCEVTDTRGLFYNPITGRWWWVFFLSVWYALVATKLS